MHGTLGVWGVIYVGIFASGYPSLSGDAGVATVSFFGQFVGMIVMGLCGFVIGYLCAWIFKAMGSLRVPENAEINGLDLTKVPAAAFPEGIPVSPHPAE